MRKVLYLGSGSDHVPEDQFPSAEWEEVRVDADARCNPDVVADIRDLPFEDQSADAIWCVSTLEHLSESDLPHTMMGFRRVLRSKGRLVLVVPDLEAVAREIVNGRLMESLYDSPAGPVRTIDVLYGLSAWTGDNAWMAHRTGFTRSSLTDLMMRFGFVGQIANIGKWMLWVDASAVEVNSDDV